MTPWQFVVKMIQDTPSQRPLNQRVTFKAVDPEVLVDWMRKHPGQRTIDEMMVGLQCTKSTVRRMMLQLEEIGTVKVDTTTHRRHHLYTLTGE
jgi:predicted transcriptional regulator